MHAQNMSNRSKSSKHKKLCERSRLRFILLHKEEALAADSSDVPLVERHLLVLTRPAPETTIREVTYLSPRYLSTGARHPEAVTATFPPSKTDSGLCWECKSPDARLAQLRSDLLVGAVYGERYGQPPGRGLGADLTA